MIFLEISPYQIHFADVLYEKDFEGHWDKPLNNALIENIKKYGIIDPVIVYTCDRDPLLQFILKKTFPEDYIWGKLWCWRGTQRIRIARILNFPKIKALLLDETPEVKVDEKEVQRYYHKRIKLFVQPLLKRWDVLGVTEDGQINKNIIYQEF